MVKKFFLISSLVFGLFTLKGFLSAPVWAQAATQGIIGAPLDNIAGTIDITVTVHFYNKFGEFLSGSPVTRTVSRGTSSWLYSQLDSGNNPAYSIKWSTSCTDPPVLATFSGTWGDGIGPSVAAYETPSQDVHCTTPNATPSVTNTACANFGWTLVGVGSNGANISSFQVYMSTNSSQIGPGDPTVGAYATGGASARSYDFGSLAPGTYYVRVRAVSPQGVGSWSSVNQFTCGAVISSASGLGTARSCNGSGAGNIVNVSFSWTRSTPTPSDEQWIDYSVFNNNFASGFANANVGTVASSYNGSGFAQGITYYWRINNRYGANWYPSVTGSFVTPTCPVQAPQPTPTPTPPPGTCAPGCSAPGLSFSWGQPFGYVSATGLSGKSSNCSGQGGCSMGLNTFTGGEPVGYTVHVNALAGPVLTTGTTTAGGPCFCSSNGTANFSWTMRYQVILFQGPTIVQNNSAYTGTNISYSNLAPNTSYQVQVYAPDTAGGVLWTSLSGTTGGCTCPPPPPPPPPSWSITTSGFSDCTGGINAKVHLTWSSNTDNTSYTILKDGVSQGSVGGSVRSWDSAAETAGQAHLWVVRGAGGTAGTINSNSVAVTTATCASAPANPGGLTITPSCNGTNPEVAFTWTDNAANETGYWLDVNTAPWTGSTTPSPWGVKTLGANVQSFVWTTANQLDSGTPLVPTKSSTYYWRLKAFNASTQSAHVYPPAATVPPGVSFKTLPCTINYDLSARIISFSKQNFDVGESATLTVEVTNSSTSTAASAPTKLYFFPDGASVPVCKNLADGTLDPTSTPVTIAPKDSANADIAYDVSPLASPIAVGGTATINVSFKVSNTPTAKTGYAYIVPKCSFLPDPGIDPNFSNNQSAFSYVVGAKNFIETQGGDVGAVGTASVSVKSADLPVKYYQSDYVVAANSIEDKVASKNGWILKGYNKKFVPAGGLYELLDSKLRSKASLPDCTFTITVAIKQCSGNLTFNTTDTAPTGNHVFFVDGDLRIKKDFVLGGNSTMVFIVGGNVTVDLGVKRIDGIYIVKGVFNDSDVADGGVATPTDALTLNGALYAENSGGGLNLKRYFTGPYNNTNPPDRFIWDPKYIVELNGLIGIKSITWKEVAP